MLSRKRPRLTRAIRFFYLLVGLFIVALFWWLFNKILDAVPPLSQQFSIMYYDWVGDVFFYIIAVAFLLWLFSRLNPGVWKIISGLLAWKEEDEVEHSQKETSTVTNSPNMSEQVRSINLDETPASKLEQLSVKQLWKLVKDRDNAIVNQFATALIGIGALFFAYGSVFKPTTRLLIAFVGFAASVILWLHLYALRKDREELRDEIKSTNPGFFRRLDDAQSWRSKGWNKVFYWPVSRIAIYFMGLVSWSWATIILFHFSGSIAQYLGLSYQTINVGIVQFSEIFLLIGFTLAFIRQIQDYRSAKKAGHAPGKSHI